MNFPSQIFFNYINHGYREAILKKTFFMAASVLYGCGYLLLLWKGMQNDPYCNSIVPPLAFDPLIGFIFSKESNFETTESLHFPPVLLEN